jgi:hypothetical protein
MGLLLGPWPFCSRSISPWRADREQMCRVYSHSIVPGGLEVMS